MAFIDIEHKLQKVFKRIGHVLLRGKHSRKKTIFGITLSYTTPGSSFPSQPGMLVLHKGTTIILRSHPDGAGCLLCESGDMEEYNRETIILMNEYDSRTKNTGRAN